MILISNKSLITAVC